MNDYSTGQFGLRSIRNMDDSVTLQQQQPGFISAQLHRGIAGSSVFINVAVWQSVADFAQRSASRNFVGLWIRIRQAR